ncbi:MAG: cobalamin biosynthesis protein, partial [Nitrospirota bacterium]
MPDYMGLILAYSLDLAIGDPAWLPHPVRIIGGAIGKTENILRLLLKVYAKKMQRLSERIGGIFLVIIISGSTYLAMFLVDKGLQALTGSENPVFRIIGAVLLVYLISTTLATKGLTDSTQ